LFRLFEKSPSCLGGVRRLGSPGKALGELLLQPGKMDGRQCCQKVVTLGGFGKERLRKLTAPVPIVLALLLPGGIKWKKWVVWIAVYVLYHMPKYLVGRILAMFCRRWKVIGVLSYRLCKYGGDSICKNLSLVGLV
jgi:hypothetical protein